MSHIPLRRPATVTRIDEATAHLDLERSAREHQIVHHVCRAAYYLRLAEVAHRTAEQEDTQQARVTFHEEVDRYATEARLSKQIALQLGSALGFEFDPPSTFNDQAE